MAKIYTRVIGIAFLLVAFSLITDFTKFGFRPETMHKIFHVVLGMVVVRYTWNNSLWWRPFALTSGAFFSFVALFGWIFPDFAALDAFNRTDTILHSIVGTSGIFAWFQKTT